MPKPADGAARFAKGNAGGPGNPHAQHVARLRAALFKSVTPADLQDVIAGLLAQAKVGDVPGARQQRWRTLLRQGNLEIAPHAQLD